MQQQSRKRRCSSSSSKGIRTKQQGCSIRPSSRLLNSSNAFACIMSTASQLLFDQCPMPFATAAHCCCSCLSCVSAVPVHLLACLEVTIKQQGCSSRLGSMSQQQQHVYLHLCQQPVANCCSTSASARAAVAAAPDNYSSDSRSGQ